MNDLIDPVLIAAAEQPSRPDTETIWNEFSASLRWFIRSQVSDEIEVDDILQDVFLKIHSNVATIRDENRLVSWIYQITRHAITDHYRRQQPLIDIPETLAADDDDTSEEEFTQRLACSISGMVDGLPNKYREALVLGEYQGLTQQQIATQLGVSLSGAKSRVQRARDMLKAELLMCCHFELDRRGSVIDYYPHRASWAESQSNCTC